MAMGYMWQHWDWVTCGYSDPRLHIATLIYMWQSHGLYELHKHGNTGLHVALLITMCITIVCNLC